MTPTEGFEQLTAELTDDPDLDVTVHDYSLLVKTRKFAHFDGQTLTVRLPASRAHDLVTREVAELGPADGGYQWVRVIDQENWSELARESHEAAQEHRPGGQS